jgi:hypothetical protein
MGGQANIVWPFFSDSPRPWRWERLAFDGTGLEAWEKAKGATRVTPSDFAPAPRWDNPQTLVSRVVAAAPHQVHPQHGTLTTAVELSSNRIISRWFENPSRSESPSHLQLTPLGGRSQYRDRHFAYLFDAGHENGGRR